MDSLFWFTISLIIPQVQEAPTASELMETEAEEAVVAVDMEAEVEQPKVSAMETNDDGNDNTLD